jgi:peptidoglycan/xylan/chitin deacetylase (PgdA/CDA1 family)
MPALKHLLRDTWLSGSYYAGLSQLYNATAGRKQGVISFHNVLPVNNLPAFDAYNVDVMAAVFDEQLAFLKKNFRVLPIAEIENPTAKGLFLTVDDGMLNNYEILAPLLQKHNLTALFAICPAAVDGQIKYIWRDHLHLLLQQHQGQKVWLPTNNYTEPFDIEPNNALTRLFKNYVYEKQIADVYGLIRTVCERNGWPESVENNNRLRFEFMSWPQIIDLIQQGHRVASHTMTHRVLRLLSNDEKYYELHESKTRLETMLKVPVNTIVYPYGGNEIDAATVQVAQQAGYTTGFMNVQHHTLPLPLLTRPRFALPPTHQKPHLHAVVSGYKFIGKKILNFFSK